MQGIEFLEQFLDKTDWYLGVGKERYGSAFRSIVLSHRTNVDFLFECIENDRFAEASMFLSENSLFPTACGETLGQSLRRLSAKLDDMYRLTVQGVEPKFKLIAEYDVAENEEKKYYDVSFDDIVTDLCILERKAEGEAYWYGAVKDSCGPRKHRNLHAWLNFQ